MKKSKKLIIVGIGETALIAYEYFREDSPYEVVGFSVTREYIKDSDFMGLPIFEFEDLERHKSPSEYELFVAISFVKLNRIRAKMYFEAKKKGYKCASYISKHAFVWGNVQYGENVFIFENNVLQVNVVLGNNITIWSSAFIGHRTLIRDHVFISSHCTIAGFCEIGEYSFLGASSTCNDHVKIAKDNIIASGALIKNDTEIANVLIGSPARATFWTSYDTFKVLPDDLNISGSN